MAETVDEFPCRTADVLLKSESSSLVLIFRHRIVRTCSGHIDPGGQPAYFVRSDSTVQGASNLSQNTWRFDTRWFNYQYAPRDARYLYAAESVEIKVITG